MKSKLDNIYYYIFKGIKCVFFVEWKMSMYDRYYYPMFCCLAIAFVARLRLGKRKPCGYGVCKRKKKLFIIKHVYVSKLTFN